MISLIFPTSPIVVDGTQRAKLQCATDAGGVSTVTQVHCAGPGSDALPPTLALSLARRCRDHGHRKDPSRCSSLRGTRHRPDPQPHGAEPRGSRSP